MKKVFTAAGPLSPMSATAMAHNIDVSMVLFYANFLTVPCNRTIAMADGMEGVDIQVEDPQIMRQTAQPNQYFHRLGRGRCHRRPGWHISHNMRQVFDLMHRVAVFRRGRICANLKVQQFSQRSIQ